MAATKTNYRTPRLGSIAGTNTAPVAYSALQPANAP
jgi:hypothetical protein